MYKGDFKSKSKEHLDLTWNQAQGYLDTKQEAHHRTMTIGIFSVKFAGLLKEAFIISCIILDNQEWKYNVRQQAESITCKTATPTATPATGTKLASTHSSPARRHPRSKMLRSPGWEDKISLSTNYNQPPSQHAARELACTSYWQ